MRKEKRKKEKINAAAMVRRLNQTEALHLPQHFERNFLRVLALLLASVHHLTKPLPRTQGRMAARGGGSARTREGPEGCPPQSSSDPSLVRPKVSISVMRAALASAGVPTAGLLERAEFEALYWKLKEGGGGDGAGAALFPALLFGTCAYTARYR